MDQLSEEKNLENKSSDSTSADDELKISTLMDSIKLEDYNFINTELEFDEAIPQDEIKRTISDIGYTVFDSKLTLDQFKTENESVNLIAGKIQDSLDVSYERKDWFTLLPDEIILLIFKHLHKTTLVHCSLVCKRWYALATDETLWKSLYFYNDIFSPGDIGHMLSRQALALDILDSEIPDPVILPESAAFSQDFQTKLMYFCLMGVQISVEGLTTLLSKCSNLKIVSFNRQILDDEICQQLANNTQLEVLELSHVKGFTETGTEVLFEACTNLVELHLCASPISEMCWDIVCSKVSTQLEIVNLVACENFNGSHLKLLISRCPNIKKLNLEECSGIKNQAILEITQLTQLNYLALQYLEIKLMHLKKLKLCKSLKYLDLKGEILEYADYLQAILGEKVKINHYVDEFIFEGGCRWHFQKIYPSIE